jgi:CubicO group peptidase (beta-lactamase class C family)
LLTLYWLSFTGKYGTAFAQPLSGKENLDRQIDSLMLMYNIPGLQLAIVQNEQIVYHQSYGWAEKESETRVSDSSLFRIASISKPITLVAILKLQEENKLSTGQLVFGEGGILSGDFTIPDHDRVKRITIQHLLDHKSGWTNEPDDPMFWNPNLTQQQIIQRILSSRPPKYEPGTRYDYSNFGYCLLGRIIEKITGMPYETYVRKEILLPCGITDMVIAGDTFDERYSNEVAYYSQEGTGAYMMAVRRMDSHGGWIASATDLVRLLTHIDRNPKVKDIIPEESMKGTYLAFHTWIHTGSLPGTSTLLVRKDDTWGYAVLANTRTLTKGNIFNEIQGIINEIIK